MAKTRTKARIIKGPPQKVLAKDATRVTTKFTKAERAEHDRIAALAEEEFGAKPVSATRIAVAKLRSSRQLANISLADLAKTTGIAKPSLSRLENHGENVNLTTLEKYANGIGCRIAISIGGGEPVAVESIKIEKKKEASPTSRAAARRSAKKKPQTARAATKKKAVKKKS